MNAPVIPPQLAPPAANYAHAVHSEGPTRWLHTSGVVPVRPDGSVPEDVAEQASVVWSNISTMLATVEMGTTDIVSVTTYVVASADHTEMEDRLALVMGARDEFMEGHLAASTLVTVPMLARPEWLVEVAAVAAASV